MNLSDPLEAYDACVDARHTLTESMAYHASPELEQSIRVLNTHMEGLWLKVETEQRKANKAKG